MVFLSVVLLLVLVMGTLMYVVEGPQNGFTSIPVAMYWAVTTRPCAQCMTAALGADDNYCRHCGTQLPPYRSSPGG